MQVRPGALNRIDDEAFHAEGVFIPIGDVQGHCCGVLSIWTMTGMGIRLEYVIVAMPHRGPRWPFWVADIGESLVLNSRQDPIAISHDRSSLNVSEDILHASVVVRRNEIEDVLILDSSIPPYETRECVHMVSAV